VEGGEMKNFLRILTTKSKKSKKGRMKNVVTAEQKSRAKIFLSILESQIVFNNKNTYSTSSTLRFFSFLPEYAGD
jgi:hypothetical protein